MIDAFNLIDSYEEEKKKKKKNEIKTIYSKQDQELLDWATSYKAPEKKKEQPKVEPPKQSIFQKAKSAVSGAIDFGKKILNTDTDKLLFGEPKIHSPIPVDPSVEENRKKGIKPVKYFTAGIGDVLKTAGSTAKWLGNDGLAQSFTNPGSTLQMAVRDEEPLKEIEFTDLFDPGFYSTRIARSMPFAISLIPLSVVGAYAGAAVGGAVGMGAFGTAVLGSIGAAGLSRPLESALEAGGTYDEMIQKGKTDKEAREAANKTFKNNLALVGLDAAEFITAFAPLPTVGKPWLRGVLKTAGFAGNIVMEGGEEVVQSAISQSAQGEKIDVTSKQVQEEFMVGGVMGGGMGVAGAVFQKVKVEVSKAYPEQYQAEYQKAVESGSSDQAAELQALDKVASANKDGVEKIAEETIKKTLAVDQAGTPSNNIEAPNLPKSGLDTKESPSLTSTREPGGASKSTEYVLPSQTKSLDLASEDSIRSYVTTIQDNSQKNLKPFVNNVEAVTGVKPEVRVKTEESIRGKLERYRIAGKQPTEMSDILAGRIIVDKADVNTQIKNIQKNFKVVETTNFFESPTVWGYTGVNMKVELPNGMQAELQVHTPQSIEVGNKIHKIYEKWRNLDLEKLTDEQRTQMKADMAESQRISDEVNRGGVVPQQGSIEQLAESKTGWKPGMREKFDTALFNKDAEEVKKLLPEVPEEYKKRFDSDISNLVGEKSSETKKITQPQLKRESTQEEKEILRYKDTPKKKTLTEYDPDAYKGIAPENIVHFNQGQNARVTLIVPASEKQIIEAGAAFSRFIKGKSKYETYKVLKNRIASMKNISTEQASTLITETHKKYKELAKANATKNYEVILNTISKEQTVVKDFPIGKKPSEDPLIQEAKKYKSAEEFVKGYENKLKDFDVFDDKNWSGIQREPVNETAKLYRDFMKIAQDKKYQQMYEKGLKDSDVLTDIWNQANKKVPTRGSNKGDTVFSPQEPVGTGKLRKSQAYQRVIDRLDKEAQEDVSYNKLNLKEDAENAMKFVMENPKKAYLVAKGLDAAPKGMTETAVSIALADRANQEKNYKLQAELEASRSLRQTRRGQEIVSERGRFNENSPYTYIRQLIDMRMQEAGKNLTAGIEKGIKKTKAYKSVVTERVDQQVRQISQRMKFEEAKIQSAQEIIDSLICT